MNLSAPHTIEATPAESLDRLWREAETLGRIEVDRPPFVGGYRARIRFERSTGTVVWAEGKDQNVAFAVAAAINEAREMGAGAVA